MTRHAEQDAPPGTRRETRGTARPRPAEARRARRRRAPSRRQRGPAAVSATATVGSGKRSRPTRDGPSPDRGGRDVAQPPTLPAASRPCSSRGRRSLQATARAQGQADPAERQQPEPERHRVREDDARELLAAEPPACVEAIAHRRAREHREADVVGDRVRQKRGERDVDPSAGACRCTRTRESRSP